MEPVFLNHCFGIETEMTGIARNEVPFILGADFCQRYKSIHTRFGYVNYSIPDNDGMIWNVKYDSSIMAEQRSSTGRVITTPNEYKVELISPILTYDRDIVKYLWVIKKLRDAGAFVNQSCGIHIHLDGRQYTSHDVKNLCNIVASRTDLFAQSLQIVPARRREYCRDLDPEFLRKINVTHEVRLADMEDAWYSKFDMEQPRDYHYNKSRYSFLNLHSFFHGHQTVELRCFNSSLNPEVIRAYILFALGLNRLAQTTKYTWYKPVEADNPRYTMIHFLQRIGFKGQEYSMARQLLTAHLPGDPNWRSGQRP